MSLASSCRSTDTTLLQEQDKSCLRTDLPFVFVLFWCWSFGLPFTQGTAVTTVTSQQLIGCCLPERQR